MIQPGTFALKGDIVDVFPAGVPNPIRIEFDDDQVEDVRIFEAVSQLSIQKPESVEILLLPTEEAHGDSTVLDYLGPEWLIIARDPAELDVAQDRHLAVLSEDGVEHAKVCFADLAERTALTLTRLKLPPSEGHNLGCQIIAPSGSAFEDAVETLARASKGKRHLLLAHESESSLSRFRTSVGEESGKDRNAVYLQSHWPDQVVHLFERSFHSPLLQFGVINHGDLFLTKVRRQRTQMDEGVVSEAIESFLSLDEGDYVVHLAHGLARFEGIRCIDKGGAQQDHLVLRFRNDVLLHVPATKIDLVQKYVGGQGDAPDLSRLGSATWEKRKRAAQEAVADLAAELLELQAIRARKPGVSHGSDTPWQQEFEAAFPFQLTPDQARSVDAIKKDLESPRPMDRLICGDVGYGKTEVAMRAAFKVVMGNRQVAMLVPTTVLAQQHLATFRERMRDYPVVIEGLSRFQTKTEQKRILEELAQGSVDIVIGTHRLVQDDVTLKRLGLLIIDEEQRFGVVHKEKLRRLRAEVDVLVMTATPIPRTLNQALLGIRDISPLGQAPRGRREVHSEVVPYQEELVRTAILRELDRGGQAFFVHNKVHSIHRIANKVQELVPEARILVGHGQMPERTLERTMVSFLNQEADVLVATTIIEAGLDIPSANTIFVDEANNFGLADLHQLRGRVGRSSVQAYAYFLVRPGAHLSEIAEKRLLAIEEFHRLGAGFQIAMRDMEIRGAGNILGAQQSGHIAAVGYELYCRLLEAAVKRLKGEPAGMPQEVELNLDFTAFIPESYVPAKRERVEMYRMMARCESEGDFRRILGELSDRFGPPPQSVQEFVLLARIRGILEHHRIQRIEIIPNEGVVLRPRRLKKLLDAMAPGNLTVRILSGKDVLLARPQPFRSPRALLQLLQQVLGEDTWAES